MAALYIAAAWLCIEVAGALIDLSVLPGTMGPWVVVLLAVGFPIALIVSWEGQPVLAAGGRRTDFIIIAMLAAAVILLLVWEPPASGDDALTVLPFESMTGPDEATFSEGLSIELLNLMAQLRKFKVKQPPEAKILQLFSDIPTLAREMDVRWVLKGSVRRAESRVRIAVQLIDADDDAAIAWSNVFDRDMSAVSLFAIQTEIARSIVGELRQSLDESEAQRLVVPPTESTEAYNAYLVGRRRLTDRRIDWLEDAAEQFARAIDLDPDFGIAYSGLVDACALYQSYSNGQKHERCPDDVADLLALAREAVRLSPDSGEAWVSLGAMIREDLGVSAGPLISDYGAWKDLVSGDKFQARVAEAEAAFQRGLMLNPGHSQGYHWYALFLQRKSMWDETYSQANRDDVWWKVIEKGLEIDPLSLQLHFATSYPDYTKTREKSLWHARRIVEIAPDSPRGYMRLGGELWRNFGRADEMVRLASKAATLDPRHAGYPESSAFAYLALGDYDMALAYFQLTRALGGASFDVELGEALGMYYAGRADEAIERFESLQGKAIVPNIPLNFLVGNDLAAGQTEKALARYRQIAPACFEEPVSPDNLRNCPLYSFGRVLQILEEDERIQRMLEIISKESERWAWRWEEGQYYPWRLGQVRTGAFGGRHEEALSILVNLVEKGYRGYMDPRIMWRFFAYHDISVDTIRDHPRFRAAISVIEADMAQQLENVREMERNGEVPSLDEVQAMVQSNEQESGSGGE
jgi:TolB-like protein